MKKSQIALIAAASAALLNSCSNSDNNSSNVQSDDQENPNEVSSEEGKIADAIAKTIFAENATIDADGIVKANIASIAPITKTALRGGLKTEVLGISSENENQVLMKIMLDETRVVTNKSGLSTPVPESIEVGESVEVNPSWIDSRAMLTSFN